MERVLKNKVAYIKKLIPRQNMGTFFSTSEYKKCIIGLSGGIDSSLVAYLLNSAFSKDNIKALLLPYGNQDMNDALLVATNLQLDYEIIDIKPMIDTYFRYIETLGGGRIDQIRKGNKMARERMSVLYDYAYKYDGVVVGTTNKTEWEIGYFTKYGDGGVDIEPIIDLYKTDVYELAKYIGIPKQIINKKPSAGLWDGQTDEDELGISYERLDKILKHINENGDTEKLYIPEEEINIVNRLIYESKHKREQIMGDL